MLLACSASHTPHVCAHSWCMQHVTPKGHHQLERKSPAHFLICHMLGTSRWLGLCRLCSSPGTEGAVTGRALGWLVGQRRLFIHEQHGAAREGAVHAP